MSRDQPSTHDLALQLYRDHKATLDLLAKPATGNGFDQAVRGVFGERPLRGKLVRIGNGHVVLSEIARDQVSFLPAGWVAELEKTRGAWDGCENWWAGYPLISWVEFRVGDDGRSGSLRLHAEVGPITNGIVRQGFVEAIRMKAAARQMGRIRFPDAASQERRLYSRFLHQNVVAVKDIADKGDIERQCVHLVGSFSPEFDLVASVIPQLRALSDRSASPGTLTPR